MVDPAVDGLVGGKKAPFAHQLARSSSTEGLVAWPASSSRNFLNNSVSWRERLRGVCTWTCTSRSPRLQRLTWWNPLFLIFRIWPFWVAGGILIFSAPSKVWMVTWSPSAAWEKLIGRRSSRSWPCRWKRLSGLDAHDDIQVAGRSALAAAFAFAGDAQAVAFVDAGREGHLDLLVFALPAVAVAFRAGVGDDLAAAPAGGAGGGHGEKTLADPDVAAAAAIAAGFRVVPGLASRAVAGVAVLLPLDLDLLFHPEEGFLQGQLDLQAQVAALARPPALPAARERPAEAEHVAQDVAEIGKDRNRKKSRNRKRRRARSPSAPYWS